MEKLRKKVEKMHAHDFMQHLTALWQYEQMGRNNDVSRLKKELSEQVLLWGGISEIEGWIKINDPASLRPSDVKGLDLSLLE